MTGAAIGILLYRGAVVDAPTDRQTDRLETTDSGDDPVSVGRNTRARTHIVELLARARAHERTYSCCWQFTCHINLKFRYRAEFI